MLTDLQNWMLGIRGIEKQQARQASKLDVMQTKLSVQQRELAEVKGMLKALVTMQSGRALPSEKKR